MSVQSPAPTPEPGALAEALVQSSVDGLLAFDRECRYTLWNAAMERFTGVPAAQVIGQRAFERFPHLVEIGVDRLFFCALAGETTVAENYAVVRDGERRFYDRHYSPLWDAAGNVIGGVGVVRDVTQRRLAEEALGARVAELRVAQKMEAIGRLAGGVAHDFNNLLTVILSCTDLLGRASVSASPGYVAEIASAAERGAALTRQLLTFSSLQPVQARAMDLNAVVAEAQEMLRRLISEHITLVAELDPDARYVRADPGQIEQVILNLVLNARDAIGEGSGKIRVCTARAGAGHGGEGGESDDGYVAYVALRVEDDGVGMSEEVKSHLFEPFFTTKPRGKGTGLGLATVYGIVQQTAGRVGVRSVPGEGTTVEVLLPATDEIPLPRMPSSRPAARPRGEETVLLVEDEAPLRRVIREVLAESGYEVVEASDGHEATRTIARLAEEGQPIDLVLTDVVMPGPSGRELAATVRARWPGARVLLMSGYDDDATKEGAEPILGKPFTAAALTRRVREVLDAAPLMARGGGGAGGE